MRRIRVLALDLLEWIAWKYVRHVVAWLPIGPLVVAERPLLWAQRLVCRRRRAVTGMELQACGLCSPADVDRVVAQVFDMQLRFQIKTCHLSTFTAQNIEDRIPIVGREHLDHALRQGRGAILLNPHFGPFLLAMPALGHRGYTVSQLAGQGAELFQHASRLQQAVYREKLKAIEGNMPVHFINTAGSRFALKNAFRLLRQNGILLMPSTTRVGANWACTTFLGRPAAFSLAAFRLARDTGAALLPVFLLDSCPFAELHIAPALAAGADDEIILQCYIDTLERLVRQYPALFGYFLCDMRVHAHRDDHPFFADYEQETSGGKRGRGEG